MRWSAAGSTAVVADRPGGSPARRLIVNARVATGDPRRPWADAILLDDAGVVQLGASAELRKRAPDATVIDARGAEWSPQGRPL
jgi:predicted amidohydrolase YtcJ